MENIKASDLKNGKEFHFTTPETTDDLRTAEVSFNKNIQRFCIWFNGSLFSFKSFNGMKNKLKQLISDWNLETAETGSHPS